MIVLVDRPNSGVRYHFASLKLHEALQNLRTKSATAKALIEFDEASTKTVQILCAQVPCAFGPFCDEWALLGPCIVWSPTKKFKCKAGEITGYSKWSGAPTVKAGSLAETVLPPEITLIHELGHFKQWIEDPGIFASRGTDGAITHGHTAVKDLEADNLKRHEVPVCKEMGLRQRQNYADFTGFTDV
jgi:hypothetical protein